MRVHIRTDAHMCKARREAFPGLRVKYSVHGPVQPGGEGPYLPLPFSHQPQSNRLHAACIALKHV